MSITSMAQVDEPWSTGTEHAVFGKPPWFVASHPRLNSDELVASGDFSAALKLVTLNSES
jgi:hypothetical protein